MFQHFMIDPPWPKRKGGLRSVRPMQGRNLDYATMSVDDIFLLLKNDVLPMAEEIHNVFLWTVDSFLVDAEKGMEQLGYKRHARIIWDKGNGVAPAFTIRYSHEYLLWYYRPSLLKVATEQRGKFLSVIREPSREHSRKPESAYSLVDSLYPEGERIDVFSREARSGWSQWGNECNRFAPEKGKP